MEPTKKKEKKKKKSGLRLFGKILLGIFIFILLLLLFIRSPWGQNIITQKLVSYIAEKTNTEVQVDRLFITFGGDIYLEGLYLEDEEGDTLVYSRELQADIPLWPIIRGKGIAIDEIEWSGVRANIKRKDTIDGFNFSFLAEAFATTDTTATATPADTSSAGAAFTLGDVYLEDFKVNYDDQYMGIDMKVDLGSLEAEVREFNLDSMIYKLGDASLQNTRFSYVQTKPFPNNPDEPAPPLPHFAVESLEVNDVVGDYQSIPDGFLTDFDIGELLLEMPEGNLEENVVMINNLNLRNSEILVKTSETAQDPSEEEPNPTPEEPGPFEWPAWRVVVEEISLVDNDFKILLEGKELQPDTFDPNAFVLTDMNLQAHDIALKDQSFQAKVERLNFSEPSGIDLKRSEFNVLINEDALRLTDLLLQLNGNHVEGSLVIDYQSLDQFIQNPEQATVDLNLPEFRVDLEDLYKFQPDLRQNQYFATLAKKPLYGNLRAQGELSSVEIEDATVNWGANTTLAAEGTVFNAADPDNLSFSFPRVRLNSSKGDIAAFIEEQDLGFTLPKDLTLSGSFAGSPEDIKVDAILNSSAGRVNVEGRFVTAPGIAFDADIQVTELEVGQLLQNEALGPVSLEISATGSGESLNDLDAIVQGSVTSMTYNGYEFEDLDIYAELEDGEGFAKVDYKDDNLNMELESFVQLDSVAPKIALQLNLIGADLQALGITQRQINTGFDLRATFEGNTEVYDVTANVNEGVFVYDDETYLLGALELLAHVRPDTTSVDIDNKMLNLRLSSNAGPMDFINALDRHYQSYYTLEDRLDTVARPVNIELRAEVSPSPILEEVFLPQLEEMDTVKVRVDFQELEKRLAAQVSLPYLNYFGSEIDSLQFNLNSDREGLLFDFGLKRLNAGPLAIKETILEGELIGAELVMDFTSNYEDQTLVHVSSSVTREDDVLRVHIDPENLILNAAPWDVDPQNAILIGENEWAFNEFVLSRENQLLRASNDLAEIDKDHIGIEFENFRLAALFSYLNPEELLAYGRMNGNFVIEEPFGNTGLVADLLINEFGVLGVTLGDLTLEGESVGANTYNFDLAIRGNADLDLTGSYVALEETANLDLRLALNEIKMEVIEGFSQGAITATDGSFSGEVTVSGTTAEPIYEGNIEFNNAAFRVATLGTGFLLPDEDIRITNEGIYTENFEILDVNRNSLVLDGAVLTSTLLNPDFDMSFRAENFTALNSEEGANDLFYGRAVFDVTGSLTGNLELPRVEMDLTVGEETDLTYIIPEGNLEIEEREGVVVFVNRQNPNRILTQTEAEEEAVSFSGFLLNSYISIEENATFTVILDPDTGDNFRGTGEGDILFDIYPNGRTTMSGRVELQDGHYEMSLYNLVTRKFDIMEGSSIVWAGDPMDADLNITAVYNVEASASALMAPQLTSVDMDTRGRFRQELDFLVYLKIGGELNSPRISFGLDMPEDEQGAISGQVYGRVQQINQQENELNKQVFSLLVLNRFFPDSGSDGAGGGTLGFARDNLNDALSDQLNIFSDRLLGETGVDLNFGLDSYTDYQGESPEERTQLDIAAERSFFDDRLIVSVGSEVELQGSDQVGESTPVIGNVSLEYLLTEDGRFRLEAFRRRSFENVIDGQLIVSGLALIFSQEFNKFRELWDQIVSDEKKQQEEPVNEPEKTEL